MKKNFLLVIVFWSWISFVCAQIPAGYYNAAAGKTGEDLQIALHNIIKGHTIVTYTPGVWSAFHTTDVKPNGTVWDIYSDIPNGTPNGDPPYIYQIGSDQCGSGGVTAEGQCYSREHSFPKSWFGGEVSPMYTDLFHLYPTDQFVNNHRSNNPYGEVGNATWTSENGSMLGDCITTGYSGTVFEPIDEYKGDLARGYFYMATRYEDVISTWQNNNPGGAAVLDGTSFPAFQTWYLRMILSWNSEDPVSEKEISRNEAVYQIQKNRNPFIDHPEYVNLIWGNPIGVDESDRQEIKVFPNPATNSCSIRMPLSASVRDYEVILVSMTGEKIVPRFHAEGNRISLDLQGLESGVYFIQLTDKSSSGILHAKLLKAQEN
jgi:endonuclease I